MSDGTAIYEPSSGGAFRQAEILSDINQIKRTVAEQTDSIVIDLVHHSFAVIVSQDCDLDLDFKARNGLPGPEEKFVGPEKIIPNILICEVFTAEELRAFSEIKPPIWSRIKTNEHIRYHFFQRADVELDGVGKGLPEMVADFKRYFSIPGDDLYDQLARSLDSKYGPVQRRLRLKSPYCEHFSTRFSYYLSRVALPEPHHSSTSATS